MPLTLTSAAFRQGSDIPRTYTCDSENTSPPFAWSGAPESTRSFLFVCNDPDAPGVELKAGYGAETLANDFRQAINDFGTPGYGGPCPPRGDRRHRYHFRLSALSEASLPAASSPTCVEVIKLASPHVLEFAELVGHYKR